ncbi:rna-directed dna polymerase from mobile element jockey-like [Willisornis vidua]|uniref:Rna-directed dna polymerase from mobile element jockey-like n=1 Tax=Willisornis vidua TaxID=1566151 RepID=A0ABQ9CWU0_9PASS|nr:rna-directed dna polymerase from mobile element jockey-like [Willisornis vidua]
MECCGNDMAIILEGKDAIQRDPERHEMDLYNPCEVRQGQVQDPAPVSGQFHHKYKLSRECIKSSPEEKDLGVLLDERLDINWQCAIKILKVNDIVGCVKRSVVSRSREVILPFYSALVKLQLEYCIQLWDSQN